MDFKGIFQIWLKVLTSPGEEVFVAERESASATLRTALVWMVLASIVAALLGLLQTLMFASAVSGLGQVTSVLPAELQETFGAMAEAGESGGPFASLAYIIAVPIGFLIWVGVYHLIATILGGRGQYGRYAYLLASFGAPLTIVNSLLALVPLLGSCLGVILVVYQFVLAYHATKVEYGLSQGKAIVAVLLPVIALALLFLCVIAVAGAALMAAFQ